MEEKRYVALKGRLDIKADIPGYTTQFYELIENIPHYYRVKLEIDTMDRDMLINKQSAYNTMTLSEKKKDTLILRVEHLNWGIRAMIEELKKIHDKEILRIADRDDSTTPKKARDMLRKGKEAYEEYLKFSKEYENY